MSNAKYKTKTVNDNTFLLYNPFVVSLFSSLDLGKRNKSENQFDVLKFSYLPKPLYHPD